MENENKQYVISREMYKKIKSMDREQLQVFATTIYLDGVKSVETTALDLDKLRAEIGAVKGIGESRLNEIMTIIEKNTQIQEKKI
ncbi:MAG: hypothetical protein J6N70_13535 [Oribacterium sp.]|nr:hypothetical protein [Oribacterium sp.]